MRQREVHTSVRQPIQVAGALGAQQVFEPCWCGRILRVESGLHRLAVVRLACYALRDACLVGPKINKVA